MSRTAGETGTPMKLGDPLCGWPGCLSSGREAQEDFIKLARVVLPGFLLPALLTMAPGFCPGMQTPPGQDPRNFVPIPEASESNLQSSYMQDAALSLPAPRSPALREEPSTMTGVHARAWWTGSQRPITASRPPCFRASPTAPSANRRP